MGCVVLVCVVRKYLLSALPAGGGLWGDESLLRERIPLQNFPLVGKNTNCISSKRLSSVQFKAFGGFYNTCSQINPELYFCISFYLSDFF